MATPLITPTFSTLSGIRTGLAGAAAVDQKAWISENDGNREESSAKYQV